jgi:hypothetical protein
MFSRLIRSIESIGKSVVIFLLAVWMAASVLSFPVDAQTPTSDLKAAFSFNEGTGETVFDSSGNANTGMITGAAWTTQGKFGNALAFNGTNSRLAVANSPSLQSPSTAITASAWIRPNGSSQAWSSVIHKVHAANYISYGFGQNAGSTRRFSGYLQVNGVGYTTAIANAMTDLTWHFVALTWQSGQQVTLTIYNANGSIFQTVTTAQTPVGTISYDASPLLIGEDEAGDNWNGTIDEVRIYDRVLTPNEIQSDMNTPIAPGPPPPPPPPSSEVGQWDGPFALPLVAVNMTLLHTEEVLMWDGQGDGYDARLWNPTTNTFTSVPSNDNIFCAGQTSLPDGKILVVGGHAGSTHVGIQEANIFDPATDSWIAATPMSYARWYPTATTLPDGRILVTLGEINCDGCQADIPEIYNATMNSWTRLTNARLALPYYPHMFVLPDGRVLAASTAEGSIATRVLNVNTQTWTTVDPLAVDGGSAAMYLPGKVIKSGKSTDPDQPSTSSLASTYVLDMTQASPAWQQTAPMAFPRTYHFLTLLPDGNVLVTGGGTSTAAIDLAGAVLEAELWSPVTKTWTTMARMQVPRLYHSTALLLPDARVLVAGGGRFLGYPDPSDQFSAEIYSPPYLFKGVRPTITSAPATIQYGTPFSLGTPDGSEIALVSLVRLGSVTHAFNFDQRFLALASETISGGLSVQAPANANMAPPGYYMVFIVDTNGVPSVAAIVRLL